MTISANDVKSLREMTGAGMMDCKEALTQTQGDVEKAVEYLRKKGMASAQKRSGREAKEGIVMSYMHPGNRLGVLSHAHMSPVSREHALRQEQQPSASFLGEDASLPDLFQVPARICED